MLFGAMSLYWFELEHWGNNISITELSDNCIAVLLGPCFSATYSQNLPNCLLPLDSGSMWQDMIFFFFEWLNLKNTGVGSLFRPQGMFLSQRLNPSFLHCRWILYHQSHQGSPISIPYFPPYPSSIKNEALVTWFQIFSVVELGGREGHRGPGIDGRTKQEKLAWLLGKDQR